MSDLLGNGRIMSFVAPSHEGAQLRPRTDTIADTLMPPKPASSAAGKKQTRQPVKTTDKATGKATDKVPSKVPATKSVAKLASKKTAGQSVRAGPAVETRKRSASAKPPIGYSPSGQELSDLLKDAGLTEVAAAELIYSTRRTLQDWKAEKAWMHPGLWELLQMRVADLPK